MNPYRVAARSMIVIPVLLAIVNVFASWHMLDADWDALSSVDALRLTVAVATVLIAMSVAMVGLGALAASLYGLLVNKARDWDHKH